MKKPVITEITGFFAGAPAGIRTPDTLLKRQVLCLLSYWGACIRTSAASALYGLEAAGRAFSMAGMAGLEPTISESKSGVLPVHYVPVLSTEPGAAGL